MPSTPQTAEAALAKAIAIVGRRGSTVLQGFTAKHTEPVREWLKANGLPAPYIARRSPADLKKVWNDTTDTLLRSLEARARTACPEHFEQSAPRVFGGASSPGMSDEMTSVDTALVKQIAREEAGLIGRGLLADCEPIIRDTVEAILRERMDLHLERLTALLQRAAAQTAEECAHRAVRECGQYTITVRNPDLCTTVELGRQHSRFPQLLRKAEARLQIWLVGEAGGGKSTAAENVAKALSLPFYFTGALDSEHKLLGFIDAQGRVVHKPFRTAYEHGGVFLFDEVDASHPAAILALNGALAGSSADFPDRIVPRHPDFICIAAANTWGSGPSSEYIGRARQDAAALDRFVYLEWPVDEDFEMALAPNKDWCRHVQAIRARVKALGIKTIVSPRATFFGARMLANGESWEEANAATIRKSMTDTVWLSVQPDPVDDDERALAA